MIAVLNAKSPKNRKFLGLVGCTDDLFKPALAVRPCKNQSACALPSTELEACMSIKTLLILAYMRLLVYKALSNEYAFVHCNRS